MLEKVVLTLQNRALLEQRLGLLELHEQAFRLALEALLQPAYLLDAAARVVRVNRLGQAHLVRHPCSKQRQLCEWIRAAHAKMGEGNSCDLPEARLMMLQAPGVSRHYLLIEGTSDPIVERTIAAASRKWTLTKQQVEILRRMVEGATNKSIAATLTCSVRSVEYHVSILLKKSGFESRVSLLASLLSDS